jgi:hypothetical protein
MRLELARGSSCKRYRALTIALEVTQDLPSGIVAWRTGDAASRMASRTAQIETRDRTSIIRVTQHRTRREDSNHRATNLVPEPLATHGLDIDERLARSIG